MDNPFIPVIILVFAFPIIWVGVILLISLLTGWRRLARYYAAESACHGSVWTMQTAYMRFGRYKNCLRVGADNHGLYLSLPYLLSFGHRPLLIPWADITTRRSKDLFNNEIIGLIFAKEPKVPLDIYGELYNNLKGYIETDDKAH